MIPVGFAERINVDEPMWEVGARYNILGLTRDISVRFFPVPISSLDLLLQVDLDKGPGTIRIRDEEGEEVISFEIDFEGDEVEERPDELGGFPVDDIPSRYPIPITFEGFNEVIPRPGPYLLTFESQAGDGEEIPLEVFHFDAAEIEPLSDEELTAIEADPKAAKYVRFELACNECGDEVKAYAGLERDEGLEDEGYVWYSELPEEFQCEGGHTAINLHHMRQNLRPLLRELRGKRGELSITRLYRQEEIRQTADQFEELLDQNPPEPELQEFIEDNPILLHFLTPERLYEKPEVLNDYEGDFASLTPGRSLIFVEIETADTGLLTEAGDIHHELTHAIGQVTDWFHAMEEYRLAVLNGLGLERQEVGEVQGVVIAGRDEDYEVEELRKLKSTKTPQGVRFYTYDDILLKLQQLADQIETL